MSQTPDPWPSFLALFHRHPGTVTEGAVLHTLWVEHIARLYPQPPDFLPPEIQKTLYSHKNFYQQLESHSLKRAPGPRYPVRYTKIRRKLVWDLAD